MLKITKRNYSGVCCVVGSWWGGGHQITQGFVNHLQILDFMLILPIVLPIKFLALYNQIDVNAHKIHFLY